MKLSLKKHLLPFLFLMQSLCGLKAQTYVRYVSPGDFMSKDIYSTDKKTNKVSWVFVFEASYGKSYCKAIAKEHKERTPKA